MPGGYGHVKRARHRAREARETRRAPTADASPMLKTTEVAKMLGVSSPNTVKNWLEGGAFPGATKTLGGHWRFPLKDVEAVKARMEWVREKNAKGDLALPADLDDGPEPPLL